MTEPETGRAYQRGAARPAAKLTDHDVEQIRRDVAAGMKQADAAEAYGVSQGLVSGIVNGRRWQHVGGPIRLTTTEGDE